MKKAQSRLAKRSTTNSNAKVELVCAHGQGSPWNSVGTNCVLTAMLSVIAWLNSTLWREEKLSDGMFVT